MNYRITPSLVETLNIPVINFDFSVRLLMVFKHFKVETILDFLSLVYRDEPGLERFGKKSRNEIHDFLIDLEPNILKSLPAEWQAYHKLGN